MSITPNDTTTPGERTGRHRLGDVDPRSATALQAGGGIAGVIVIVGWLANDINQLDARIAALSTDLRRDIAELTHTVDTQITSIREDVVDVRLDVQTLKTETRSPNARR